MANNEAQKPKLGAGALKAAGYHGLHEVGEALKAFPDSISITEPGTLGAPPPSREVYESRNPKVEPSKMSTMDPSAPEPVPEPTGPEPMPPVVMPDMDIDLDM